MCSLYFACCSQDRVQLLQNFPQSCEIPNIICYSFVIPYLCTVVSLVMEAALFSSWVFTLPLAKSPCTQAHVFIHLSGSAGNWWVASIIFKVIYKAVIRQTSFLMVSPFNSEVFLLRLLFPCCKAIAVFEVKWNGKKYRQKALAPALSLNKCVAYLSLSPSAQTCFLLYK